MDSNYIHSIVVATVQQTVSISNRYSLNHPSELAAPPANFGYPTVLFGVISFPTPLKPVEIAVSPQRT